MSDGYYRDHRVRAKDKWYESFDEKRMVAYVRVYLDNPDWKTQPDEEVQLEIPCEYAVCSTCNGRGYHVNPSIDCNGLTADDFAEDPDFMEDYFKGNYDVQCYGCNGTRVEPVASNPNSSDMKLVYKKLDTEAEMRAEYEAERRMGA